MVSNSMRLVSTGASVSGAAEGRRKVGGWVLEGPTFLHWPGFRTSLWRLRVGDMLT